jgi:lipid II:glycine glycyltransferase (peptidoglycan interpeptide bridge formation enzyme)
VTLRCFDDHPAVTAPELTRVGEAAWHSTSLAPTLDDIMAGFTPEARRAVRAAGRRGVRVVVRADLDAVAAFHRLHVGLRKGKYGLLAQPLSFFERIWESFSPSDGIVTLLAEADGEAVAGAVYLVWNDALYYKFGASRPDHLRLLPNDAIAWTAMTWAKDRGLTRLDWGLSDLDQPGLLAFKRKWGVEERTIVTLRRPGPPPSTADREFGALLGELTQVFTDGAVPDEVTARGGASLYRYFC